MRMPTAHGRSWTSTRSPTSRSSARRYAVSMTELLEEWFSTPHPTREMIEQNMDFFDDIDRGHGVSIIVYKDDKPDEIFFAGYSYD